MQRQRPGVAVLVAVVLPATLAILAGLWVDRLSAPADPPPPARLVGAGPAWFVVPGEWRPAAPATTGIVGLDADRAVAFETAPGLSEWAVATFSPTAEPSLLPSDLRPAFRGRLPEPASARLGGLPAWTYQDLVADGSGVRADVTVVPTTAGVLALVCATDVAPAASACSERIEAVAVRGAAPLIPSRSLALAKALPSALATLNRARVRDRARLSGARTPEAQGLAARRLAADHRVAARRIRAAAGTAGAPLARDLTAVADAYASLSGAADTASAGGFASARAAVVAAETALARAVRNVPEPAVASAGPGARPVPASRPGSEPAGVSLSVFALLVLLGLAAGAATGSSRAGLRLWRSAGVTARRVLEPAATPGRAARTARARARRR